MRSGGSLFKEGYRFWYRCHGRVWKFTAEEHIKLRGKGRYPVCPECDGTVDSLGRDRWPAK